MGVVYRTAMDDLDAAPCAFHLALPHPDCPSPGLRVETTLLFLRLTLGSTARLRVLNQTLSVKVLLAWVGRGALDLTRPSVSLDKALELGKEARGELVATPVLHWKHYLIAYRRHPSIQVYDALSMESLFTRPQGIAKSVLGLDEGRLGLRGVYKRTSLLCWITVGLALSALGNYLCIRFYSNMEPSVPIRSAHDVILHLASRSHRLFSHSRMIIDDLLNPDTASADKNLIQDAWKSPYPPEKFHNNSVIFHMLEQETDSSVPKIILFIGSSSGLHLQLQSAFCDIEYHPLDYLRAREVGAFFHRRLGLNVTESLASVLSIETRRLMQKYYRAKECKRVRGERAVPIYRVVGVFEAWALFLSAALLLLPLEFLTYNHRRIYSLLRWAAHAL